MMDSPRATTAAIRRFRVVVPLAAVAVVAGACGSGGGGSATRPATSSAPPITSTAGSTSSTSSDSGSGGYRYPGGGPTASAGVATVAVASDAKLGGILVDGQGRTLYLFEKDSDGKSTCFDACAKVWPPFTAAGGAPQVGATAKASLLATTSRQDGQAQVVYNGHPLYYYQGDTQPGQTNGEGLKQFGAEWYVLSPNGDKVEK